ncbi:OmpP1/FadL family transporter [Puniceibacterium sediminis]|uniref:Long-chain fatty acid transport protein n=1 Tax=Puniceibacterium sediminis TaxID=1608407 RepID=A0A238YI68_9RHOB|nr:outer membrane protein transport protein [Puniceibacterium sediminis]SNR70770.1 Long-chain fatty acid transport protein [Puniceibacterium sediminis]
MNKILVGASALALAAGTASAGGIERTTQSAMVLYEKGNHAELSFGFVSPSVTGTSRTLVADIDNVASSFWLPSAAIKMQFSDTLSAALIIDRPYGADIAYEDGNPMLGGTTAEASNTAITALLKYQFNPNFSAFGGLRHSQADGDIQLRGAAYGAVNGYDLNLKSNGAYGYVLGGAYERPDIALRVALTYNSKITHDFKTTESGPLVDPDGPGPAPAMPLLNGSSTTDVDLPESWNLEFQTGIAADTLLFGSVRYVKHSQFKLDSEQFVTVVGSGLIDLEDTTTYRVGVGRRFNDQFSGSIAVAYEAAGDKLVSPLAPSTGYTSVTLGGSYSVTDSLTLSSGISYIWLGDAQPETGTPDVARADFENNSAVGLGVKIAYKF